MKSNFMSKTALMALLVCQNANANEVNQDQQRSSDKQNKQEESAFEAFVASIHDITHILIESTFPDTEQVPDPQ